MQHVSKHKHSPCSVFYAFAVAAVLPRSMPRSVSENAKVAKLGFRVKALNSSPVLLWGVIALPDHRHGGAPRWFSCARVNRFLGCLVAFIPPCVRRVVLTPNFSPAHTGHCLSCISSDGEGDVG